MILFHPIEDVEHAGMQAYMFVIQTERTSDDFDG